MNDSLTLNTRIKFIEIIKDLDLNFTLQNIHHYKDNFLVLHL